MSNCIDSKKGKIEQKKNKTNKKKQNKAGYTATEVARGWAGAILRSPDHFGKSSEAKEIKS